MAHTPARPIAYQQARTASPTPRQSRRGPASRFHGTPSVVDAVNAERRAHEAGGGTPVNPALARMHERLRARRPLGAADVPMVAAGDRADLAAAVAAAPSADKGADRPTLAPGLERFMRLRGRSGRTYVFSRIEPRHVSLYRNGVFAWLDRRGVAEGAEARVIGDVLPIVSNAIDDGALYVHLLAQDDGDRAAVLGDLQ